METETRLSDDEMMEMWEVKQGKRPSVFRGKAVKSIDTTIGREVFVDVFYEDGTVEHFVGNK